MSVPTYARLNNGGQGRLDYTSEGLLLLTNNGRLARYLEHPSNEYERKYKVRIRGKVRANETN